MKNQRHTKKKQYQNHLDDHDLKVLIRRAYVLSFNFLREIIQCVYVSSLYYKFVFSRLPDTQHRPFSGGSLALFWFCRLFSKKKQNFDIPPLHLVLYLRLTSNWRVVFVFDFLRHQLLLPPFSFSNIQPSHHLLLIQIQLPLLLICINVNQEFKFFGKKWFAKKKKKKGNY